jgi:hypothetical protein
LTNAGNNTKRSRAARSKRATVSPSMTTLHRGAHELAESGFRVLPLKPRSKTAAITKWQEKATDSSSQIDVWWGKWPDANIGIATGGGLVVIDIDSEDAMDYAYATGLLDDETPTVKTGRPGEGVHRYFRDLNPRTKTHHIKHGEVKIEVRANSVYVVAPPSVHPDTGAMYEWMTDPDHPLALVPESALEERETVSRATEGEEGKFVRGERNDRLYKLGSAMLGIGMNRREIESALLVVNEMRCDPPLDEDEVSTTTDSAGRHPIGRPIDKDLLAVSRAVKPSALAVYIALRKSCGLGNECRQSYEGLAEQTGMGDSTAKRAVAALEKAGLVEKKERPFPQSNAYRLLDIPQEMA